MTQLEQSVSDHVFLKFLSGISDDVFFRDRNYIFNYVFDSGDEFRLRVVTDGFDISERVVLVDGNLEKNIGLVRSLLDHVMGEVLLRGLFHNDLKKDRNPLIEDKRGLKV